MTSEPVDSNTLDFIVDATKGGPADQFRNMESYDSKIIQVFAAASIIVGLTQVTQGSGESLPGIIFYAIIALYVGNIFAFVYGLWPRPAYAVFHSDTMWTTHRDMPLNDLKYVFNDSIVDSYKKNKKVLDAKARAVCLVLGATAIEGLLVLATRLV